ncbi:hypothetical protein OsJ_28174 [Oryza sativa Japonica Group]|uniref:LRAT domain-containing protein n=1 Tax=Oryza sativa subsp. japonica TaxID=39947 RepID=B9FYF4_ORYSJ|nr:hypothetical protein OsJ_28174 [Oryza sativa Japonica Group]
MGLLSHRVERSEMKPGDHIYTWRAAYTYSHHVIGAEFFVLKLRNVISGIYVGGSKVVHFTRKKEAGTAGLDSAIAISSLLSQGSPECPTFPDCGFQLPDSGVVLTCVDCFLRGGSLHGFEYGVPPAVFLAKLRGGTCTTAAADPPDAVVRRAMHLLQNGFGSYDVFENNCEDFALYCKTGLLPADEPGSIGRSGQASSAIGVPLAALLSTPFKLLAAGPPRHGRRHRRDVLRRQVHHRHRGEEGRRQGGGGEPVGAYWLASRQSRGRNGHEKTAALITRDKGQEECTPSQERTRQFLRNYYELKFYYNLYGFVWIGFGVKMQ